MLLKDAVNEKSLHLQSGFGHGVTNVVEHDRPRTKRLARPVARNLAEQAVFNRVPLGSPGWIMANHDLKAKLVSQLFLNLLSPEPVTAIVAAPGIS